MKYQEKMVKRKLNNMDDSIQSNSELSDIEMEESGFNSNLSKHGVKKNISIESEESDSENEPLMKKIKIAPKKQDSESEDFEKGSSGNIHENVSDDETINKTKQSSKKTRKGPKNIESDDSNSDNEVVLPESSSDSVKEHSSLKKSQSTSSNTNSSDDEMEPLSKLLNDPGHKGDNDSKSIYSSESDDEPLAVKSKKNSAKSTTIKDEKSKLKKNEHSESSADEKGNEESDSDSDFKPLKKKTKIQSASNTQSKNESHESCESSDDEEEPLSNLQNNASIKVSKNSKSATSCSDSDDEPLAIKANKKSPLEHQKSSSDSSVDNSSDDDDDEPLNKVSKTLGTKKKQVSISSDDEFLDTKSKKSSQKKSKANKQVKKKLSSEENNDMNSDEDKPLSKIAFSSKKAQNPSDGKIEHLKKYVRAAGIYIKSYDKLFEDCKSIKAKREKLLDMLHEKGIKGRPTLEKCKKLKKKIETKKEIAELDVSNIITSEGRSKRNSNRDTLQSTENIESTPARKKFSRLQDIIDSEDSD